MFGLFRKGRTYFIKYRYIPIEKNGSYFEGMWIGKVGTKRELNSDDITDIMEEIQDKDNETGDGKDKTLMIDYITSL